MKGIIDKELQDDLLDGLWYNIKDKVEQAYAQGYKQAKEDMLLEAKAIIEASKTSLDSTSS